MLVEDLIAAFLFVASSGLLFNKKFRDNGLLLVCAGLIALGSTYFLTRQIVDEVVSERLQSQSEPTPTGHPTITSPQTTTPSKNLAPASVDETTRVPPVKAPLVTTQEPTAPPESGKNPYCGKNASDDLFQANSLREARSVQQSIELFNKVISNCPDNDWAYAGRGEAYGVLAFSDSGPGENSTRALADMDKAIQLNPNDYHYFLDRGSINKNAHNYDAAISDYTRAFFLDRGNALLLALRGNAKNAAGDTSGALADYEMALFYNPGNMYALVWRGDIYAKQGKCLEAIQDFSKALRGTSDIAVDPVIPQAFSDRGMCYRRLGQNALAISDFRTALRLNPLYREAEQNLENTR
jgi:tetratricopeptide (TPR) repeat protein